ncbi:MAG: hypothetical protein ACTHU0_27150 [Kofleriaceae bacterium]
MLAMLAACSGSKPARPIRDDARTAVLNDAATVDAGQFVAADTSWRRSHDFDGDGRRDVVAVEYTNGAHCCYKLTVSLSAKASEVAIPFELDGGYLGGLSLDRPENFTIEVGRDGVSSFVMAIATYGGRWEEIPLAWVRRYGVRSHRVRVSLRDGNMRVENLGWDCASAIVALTQRRFTLWEGWPATCTHVDIALAIDVTRTVGNDVSLGGTAASLDHVSTIVTPDARIVTLDVYQRETRIVRIDVGGPEDRSKALVDALGPPEARLPYTMWGFTHPSGQWVWPSRGLVVYVDRTNRAIRRAGVFSPTDLAAYKRDLALPELKP